jgi:DNA-binding Lrp family transcriptional regulator
MLLDPVALTFQADVRRAYRMMGERLGVTEDTVRNRVKALEKGCLRGWRVGINPTILGYSTTSIDFDPRPVAKSESLRAMRTVPGMMLLMNYYGGYVGALVAYRNEESLKEKLGLILRGTSNPGTIERVDVRFPNCNTKLLETDWEIVKALQRNPRRRYDEVAKQVRLSPRTVRRRLERMVQGRAIFAVPDLNLKALQGVTKVTLRIG